MKHFIIYNESGKILRTGRCQDKTFELQRSSDDELIMEGQANDRTQKIVDKKIIDKTTEELEAEKPPVLPESKRRAHITNEQWQDNLNRLAALEAK